MQIGVRWAVWCFVLLAGLPSRSFAQNPPHLREMPPVDRVMREITAPDPKDAAARQAGAFSQLSDIVAELSSGRVAVGNSTPDEQRVIDAYNTARGAVMTAHWKTLADDEILRRYDEDPGLREELVNRFFSPEMRDQYIELYNRLQAGRRVLRQQNAAFGGTAAPQAAADPLTQIFSGQQAAPAQATVATGPPDPSVAQARAANVDTKVFGLQLGEPVSLPQCGLMGILVTTQQNCRMDQVAEITSLVAEIAGMSEDSDLVLIKLASESCPQWMPDCTASASLINGRLAGVVVQPPGSQVKEAVAKELIAKYGRPSSATRRTITPLEAGSPFDVIDLEWNLPGLRVEYKVVDATVYVGTVRIETGTLYQRRLANEKEAARPKL